MEKFIYKFLNKFAKRATTGRATLRDPRYSNTLNHLDGMFDSPLHIMGLPISSDSDYDNASPYTPSYNDQQFQPLGSKYSPAYLPLE